MFQLFFPLPLYSGNGGRPFQGIDTRRRYIDSICFASVEMEVAPFRALTLFIILSHDFSPSTVEMEVAPFRALTQLTGVSVATRISRVEMEVAPFRALTHERILVFRSDVLR